MTSEIAAALVASPLAERLEVLDLRGNRLGAAAGPLRQRFGGILLA